MTLRIKKREVKTVTAFVALFLKDFRRRKKLTQLELSEVMEISPWALSAYETEKKTTEIVTAFVLLQKIADLKSLDLLRFLRRLVRDLERSRNAVALERPRKNANSTHRR